MVEKQANKLRNMNTTPILYMHILCAFIMFAGSFGATLLRYAAMKHPDSPVKVAALLGVVRPVVPVVVISMLLTIAFGLWLAGYEKEHYHQAWLIATYILVTYILVVGAVAGKRDRLTRELAEQLADVEHSKTTSSLEDLKKQLNDPVAWGLNLSMVASIIVILALMVFRPGAGDDDA